MPRTARARYTLRSASAVIPFWIGVAVLAGVVVIPLVGADWRLVAFTVPPVLLLSWILWLMLYRPAVHYDAAQAVVVNFGRTHVLPWGHVVNVRQGISLIFDLDAGKPVSAFGAPAPRRTGNIMGNLDRKTRPVETFHREADLLDGFRRGAAPADAPVTSRWDLIPLAIGGVLAAAVVVEILIGI